jgi:fructosamine-3-kinase
MQKDFLIYLQQQLTQPSGEKVIILQYQQVYGGDINQTYVLTTPREKLFLKINTNSHPDMFRREFSGLQLLGSAKALTVPRPLLVGSFKENTFLLMENLKKGNPVKSFWKDFAEGLAKVHQKTSSFFGLNENNYIGNLHQSNNYCHTWAEFYAMQRILPLFRLALQQQKCTRQDLLMAEQICNKSGSIFPEESPSLLHGDLWSGNFMCVTGGVAAIYDPAVYYGHREMDIGMSLLFGGFDTSFYHYYHEIFPLENNWKERVPLCQLYPLLVHLLLFGGHYYYSVKEILQKFA